MTEKQALRVLAELVERTEGCEDEGPTGQGWKSDELRAALWAARELLHEEHFWPEGKHVIDMGKKLLEG